MIHSEEKIQEAKSNIEYALDMASSLHGEAKEKLLREIFANHGWVIDSYVQSDSASNAKRHQHELEHSIKPAVTFAIQAWEQSQLRIWDYKVMSMLRVMKKLKKIIKAYKA